MQLNIRTQNFALSDKVQDYAEKKCEKLERYLPNITDLHLDLNQERSRTTGERVTAQLTLRNKNGTILRAEDESQRDNIFAAIDQVIDKMYRQISRYKGKKRRRTGDKFAMMDPELAAAEDVPTEESEDNAEEELGILRRKVVPMAPMTEDEAIDQMELLGHDFFIFYNGVTGKTNVLYRRKGGGYGLLTPELM